jgi:catalase
LLPWEGFVPQGDAPEGDTPAASPVGELPASPLLPLVQEAIEEAARQALPPESEPVATVLLDCGRLGRVSGAAGVFAPSEGLAALFPDRMRETAARVRCCAWTAAGAPDAARCQRSVTVALDGWGGAMPFFLTPTIYSADPETMMRFERSVMPDGESGLRDPSRFWQAVTDAPESLSAVGVLFTDRGTPASWRALSGYTPPLVWETARGRLLARCTMTPAESARPLTREEAQELCLADGDALARDLWLALAQNDCPTWTLTAQLVPADRSMADPTSLWKEEIAPLELGTLTLTRNVSVTAARAWRMTTRIAAGRRNPAAAAPAFAMCSDEERRALAENLAEELEKLPADVLERVLLLITTEDLELGSALTAALGG